MVENILVTQGECPTVIKERGGKSAILNQKDLENLEKWLGRGKFSLKTVYKSEGSKCNMKVWKDSVIAKPDLLIVGKTEDGKVFGGYAHEKIDYFSPGRYYINDPKV